jgi:hypothetical protein
MINLNRLKKTSKRRRNSFNSAVDIFQRLRLSFQTMVMNLVSTQRSRIILKRNYKAIVKLKQLNYLPTMCDTGTQTHVMGTIEKKEDKCFQTEHKEFAEFGCQVAPMNQGKTPKSIIIPEREEENSLSDNSFQTIEASKSGERFALPDNLSENDEETPLIESWIPDIEKLITKLKPEKKASTFFLQHKKDQLIKSASPSPKGSSSKLPLSFGEDESTESSSKLASQLSTMLDSYKQVCKERDYLKNLLKPYLKGAQDMVDSNKGRRNEPHQFPKILDIQTPSHG